MYSAIDDRVLACSTTHVVVEDAETAGVSIGTRWFVINAFFPWLKEMLATGLCWRQVWRQVAKVWRLPKKEKNRHKLRKTKIPGGFNELPFPTSSLQLITIYSAMRFLHLKLVCCG
jgi:hypothetical protein